MERISIFRTDRNVGSLSRNKNYWSAAFFSLYKNKSLEEYMFCLLIREVGFGQGLGQISPVNGDTHRSDILNKFLNLESWHHSKAHLYTWNVPVIVRLNLKKSLQLKHHRTFKVLNQGLEWFDHGTDYLAALVKRWPFYLPFSATKKFALSGPHLQENGWVGPCHIIYPSFRLAAYKWTILRATDHVQNSGKDGWTW